MKGKGFRCVEIQKLLQFKAEDSDQFFGHLPSGVDVGHDLNVNMVNH